MGLAALRWLVACYMYSRRCNRRAMCADRGRLRNRGLVNGGFGGWKWVVVPCSFLLVRRQMAAGACRPRISSHRVVWRLGWFLGVNFRFLASSQGRALWDAVRAWGRTGVRSSLVLLWAAIGRVACSLCAPKRGFMVVGSNERISDGCISAGPWPRWRREGISVPLFRVANAGGVGYLARVPMPRRAVILWAWKRLRRVGHPRRRLAVPVVCCIRHGVGF